MNREFQHHSRAVVVLEADTAPELTGERGHDTHAEPRCRAVVKRLRKAGVVVGDSKGVALIMTASMYGEARCSRYVATDPD